MTQNIKRTGLYPGTFDPITKGHLHIISRASQMVEKLIIAVAHNDRKQPFFSIEERMALVRSDIESLEIQGCDILVEQLDTLLVEYARKAGAALIFRGLRAVSDFEYEFQMTGINARLAPEIETVFLMASDKWQFVSSSFIKEIAGLGGDISDFVTSDVQKALMGKLQNKL